MITCKFPHGNPAKLRHVTCDALAIKNNQILLVKRSPTAYYEPNKYALPGGYVDRDETVEEAVLRELYEETGYRGKVRFLLQINDYPQRVKTDDNQNISFFYIVEIKKKKGKPSYEVEKVQWFDLDKLDTTQIAFDHGQAIELYKKYRKQKFALPFIGGLRKGE